MSVPRLIFKISHFRFSASKGAVLNSSHRPSVLRWQSGQKRKRQEIGTVRVSDDLPKCLNDITLPADGVIRAAASIAAKIRRRSKYIDKFDRVLLAYACLQLDMRHGRVLEEYLYRHLKKKAKSWRLGALRLAEEIARSFWRNPQKRKQELDNLPKYLNMQDILLLADEVIRDIEGHILNLAEKGRPVKQGTRDGYRAVRATIGEHRSYTCFLILEGQRNGSVPRVLSLKTSGQFGRSTQNRLRGKERHFYKPLPMHYV
ncbi:MAG: hypothetical protein ABIB04_04890 [Patescibacteria group bacterium]